VPRAMASLSRGDGGGEKAGKQKLYRIIDGNGLGNIIFQYRRKCHFLSSNFGNLLRCQLGNSGGFHTTSIRQKIRCQIKPGHLGFIFFTCREYYHYESNNSYNAANKSY
jgi:hypothetical protein